MAGYLPLESINRLVDLAVACGWLNNREARDDLLMGIEQSFIAHLEYRSNTIDQLRLDLVNLNEARLLMNGKPGLQIWLENALRRARDSGRPETAGFQQTLDDVRHAQDWLRAVQQASGPEKAETIIPEAYYQHLIRDFENLDIAGIDKDQSYKLPLSKVYVKLRVKSGEESAQGAQAEQEPSIIEIQDALKSYPRLVIVGDPGSGKSTFLRFIALMISRSRRENDPALAQEKLNLLPPLPVPIFLSLWDFSDYLKRSQVKRATSQTILDFILDRFSNNGITITVQGLPLTSNDLVELLKDGQCCLLLDGLDEVPTEQMRGRVREMMEAFVEEYKENRYIITSRTRGYTGDAIFGSDFQRCDIRDFDDEDIRQFARNWIGAIKNVSPDDLERPEAAGFTEYNGLMEAVLHKEGVRSLAKNPLMMTVIAIVYWNRTRLPEQRVELYDECIDVLLGQRKEAQRRKTTDINELINEEVQKDAVRDRNWVRKQYSDIALFIMLHEEKDEINKKQLIQLLKEPMMNKYKLDEEAALLEAETFLDQQELRSGLLVSRDRASRFVHLTFQEYLAAWRLKSRRDYWQVILPHLREQRWFETLQLLGGLLARDSDEDLWEYLDNLLANLGENIVERSQTIALCANIVRDTQETAGLRVSTRQTYEAALRDTLGVFEPKERVPENIQKEVLDALAKLGRPVKDQLIRATQSQYRAVRSKAVEYLVPHLPDDDLFTRLTHLFNDKSKETVKTYLTALRQRDVERTKKLIQGWKQPSTKLADALAEMGLLAWLLTFDDVMAWYLVSTKEQTQTGGNYWLELIHRDEARVRPLLAYQKNWTFPLLWAVSELDKIDLFDDETLLKLIGLDNLFLSYAYSVDETGGSGTFTKYMVNAMQRDQQKMVAWLNDPKNWSEFVISYLLLEGNLAILSEDHLFELITQEGEAKKNLLPRYFEFNYYGLGHSFKLLNEASKRNEARLRRYLDEAIIKGSSSLLVSWLAHEKRWNLVSTDRLFILPSSLIRESKRSLINIGFHPFDTLDLGMPSDRMEGVELPDHIPPEMANRLLQEMNYNLRSTMVPMIMEMIRRDKERADHYLGSREGRALCLDYPGFETVFQHWYSEAIAWINNDTPPEIYPSFR